MVKDEDVCLHCGLCAERCPTGAWDMQKFLFHDDATRATACRDHEADPRGRREVSAARHETHRRPSTTSSSSSPTSTARARRRPTSCSRRRSCAWACRSARATSSRATSRACRPGTRCASARRATSGRRGGIDMMVAMNPQTWDAGRARRSSRAATCSTTARSRCRTSAFRDDVHVIGMPLTAICNATYEDPRQRQLFKNIIYVGALSVLLDIDATEIEKLFAEQYSGKERLLESNVRALHAGREFARDHLDADRAARAARQDAWASASSSTATAPPRSAACTAARRCARGTRSRRRRRCAEAFQKYCQQATASTRRPARTTTRSCRPRTRSPRSASSIGAGWNGARAFTATSGPGVSLMTEFIGLAYFAEIPVDDHRRAARRPVDRHADAHAAGRPARLRLRVARRHQARAAVPRRPARVLRARGRRARPRRPAADAGVRDDRPRHRHEPAPVRAVRVGRRARATTAAR